MWSPIITNIFNMLPFFYLLWVCIGLSIIFIQIKLNSKKIIRIKCIGIISLWLLSNFGGIYILYVCMTVLEAAHEVIQAPKQDILLIVILSKLSLTSFSKGLYFSPLTHSCGLILPMVQRQWLKWQARERFWNRFFFLTPVILH